MAEPRVHRASALKQQNKRHNKLGHKTKGQMKAIIQGRTSIDTVKRKAKHDLSRQERRNQVKVIRSDKREKTMNKKRGLGTETMPPFLVCVAMMSPDINPRQVLAALTEADSAATVTKSTQGATHVSCSRFKQRYTFVVPPINDMYAILDTAKVSSTLLLVWPPCNKSETILQADQQRLLSAIKAQGLPTTVHAALGYEDMPQKKKAGCQQNLLQEIRHYFPSEDKVRVHQLDKTIDALLCLRQLGARKQRHLYHRDHRAHLLADDLVWEDDFESASTGTLQVSGYLRGVPLSPDSLVHIPGWGDYQLSMVTVSVGDPHPLVANRGKEGWAGAGEVGLMLEPDLTRQESLVTTREVVSDEDSGKEDDGSDCDTDEGGESNVTKTTADDMMTVPVQKDLLPGAHSAYQAAWMIGNDAYKDEESDSDYDDDDDDDYDERDEFEPPMPRDEEESMCGANDDDDRMSMMSGSEMSVMDEKYDEKVDYGDEMGEYERMRECRDDLEFPDEVDTPRDMSARKRFQKYRGLESFRTSQWDLSENLPAEYARVFQIDGFNHFRKRIMALEPESNSADPGDYVTLHIKSVEKHLYQQHRQSGSPLVVFALLPHEQKMAVVNFALKSHPIGHTRPIKSKDRLIFHVGFRRFQNQPIFSDHTNGDKQKYCRYFHPGMTMVATVFAPITYPPTSVLVFRSLSGGRQELVATGSVYSVNANRCILKRVILSGHPMKIHKRSAVVRYMFFDRDDINWYKPIELHTKYGRKGHIVEPLGTHGHMKCQFKGGLKSQDTILMNLYKRMFPKWTYNPCVPRPCAMYSPESLERGEDSEDEELPLLKEDIDRALMPPPANKPRKVHFS